MLKAEVGTASFEKDVPTEESQAAAPHEIQRCIHYRIQDG